MDIRHMHEFVVLAQTCNYQIASEALYTTSSTLSRHIAQMEKELGYALFDRTTRKVALTETGELFLKSCSQIVSLYDEAIAEMKQHSTASSNTLFLALTTNIRQYGISKITRMVSAKYPEIDIRMMELGDQTLNSLLHAQKFDFAFSTRLDVFDSDIAHRLLCSDDLVFILPKDHPLAKKPALHIEELKDEPFILCNSSYHTSDRFLAECEKLGFSINVKIATGNSHEALLGVVQNQGVTVLSRSYCLDHMSDYYAGKTRLSAFITMVDIVPELSFQLYLLYLKTRPMTPAMKTYLKQLQIIGLGKDLGK